MQRRTRAAIGVPAVLLAGVVGGCASAPDGPDPSTARAQLAGAAATGSPAPTTEAAAGRMVAGFPSRLLALPPHSAVTASAVVRHGDLLEVSVTVTTATPATAVLKFYTRTLTRAGFSVTDGSMLPSGATGLAFSRRGGREILVLAVVDHRWNRSFSIGGTVAGDA